MSPAKKGPGTTRAAEDFRRRLLSWYSAHKRDLPWRQTDDAYRIWVAEVMLVQTQVDTVVPYYKRFIERFPNVRALAAANLDDVLKAWEGLGYYARARNLHRAARVVAEEHGGCLPGDAESLRALPGIGPYMTGALLAIVFDQQTLAVDGNVRRVLSRVYDIVEPTHAVVREAGSRLVSERPRDVNEALM
ncbi:MAG: A/G-specific adenine glycosylase, partial [Gemmatimonas sp. SG8_38_2]